MNFEKIFTELRKAFKNYEDGLLEKKKQITPDFNAFQIIKPLELPISQMIAEFLNPQGTHEQEQVFLNLFIDMFFKEHKKLKKSTKITVELEKNFDNGRIDILIDFDSKYGIVIENKPFAEDQNKQIIRYRDYLKSVYKDNFLILYLSADGSEPAEFSLPKEEKEKLGKKFIIISFPQIRKWYLECANYTKSQNAERITFIIEEFAEYINRTFCGTNLLKTNMIEKAIEQNILEAFEINLLWNNNKKEFNNIWQNRINELFNKELPKKVYEKLINNKIINEEWEYVEGKFDIRKKHLESFVIKKKSWKQFKIGISSTAHEKIDGKQQFFPIIYADTKINKADLEQKNRYNLQTNCNPKTNWTGNSGKIFWSADFPDNTFLKWGYEQWIEIKTNGKTVNYITEFLSKLIKVCEIDIDNQEQLLHESNIFSENNFRNFTNNFQWIFAKTYADKAPHEYIVLDKIGKKHQKEFIKIAKFIRNNGFKAFYYTREGYYYKLDDNYYWTMDENVKDTDLINRAKLSDYNLIDNSWKWKGKQ